MQKIWRDTAIALGFACGVFATPRGWAQANVVSIDATAPAPAPQPIMAKLGTSRNPKGQVIGVNSQYLTLDGKPWIPVMGEFHYSRYPQAEWEQEILKMKAAGVQIVATYVIWNHHEQIEGVWDWKGQRDLRRFVELCGKHGMYVYPRIGPWSHAEVRHGGFPDWLLKKTAVRENNPVYLSEVQGLFSQIAMQLKGELWKDGGPVIGIQLENEYREAPAGSGKGSEHIRKLKEMAVADGLDVPLYTVTGWDGAAVPLDAVLPVFGGYPDAPWDGSPKPLYGNEIYSFRFGNRVAGNMGAVGGRGQNSAEAYKGTPFLTAEVGDGGEDTYFRRPVFRTDDIAAIAPVMLGSGVNLLGYYMFHGGRNPDSEVGVPPITLEESQKHGDATDVPEKSYDFQAPIGEFGQERASLQKLKLVHYFLEDFGAELAPMVTRAPDQLPSGPKDTSVVRVAARTRGAQGFLFINNYVRGLTMPERTQFQVQLKLRSGVIDIPEKPIDLPSGSYGIWPVNLPLRRADGNVAATLLYSTAQLFKRVETGGRTYYFFFAIPGIAPSFALDAAAKVERTQGQVETASSGNATLLRATGQGEAEVEMKEGVSLVLLTEQEAEQVWSGDDKGMLLKTDAVAFSAGDRWTLQSNDPSIRFGLFGKSMPRSEQRLTKQTGKGLFLNYGAALQSVELRPVVTKVTDAKPAAAEGKKWQIGPALTWRPKGLPMKPSAAELAGSAVWRIDVPKVTAKGVSDVWLKIDYQGDEARLSDGAELIDDSFWNGQPWTVGLREALPNWRDAGSQLSLAILPLPQNYPMYLEDGTALRFNSDGTADTLDELKLIPQYQLVVDMGAMK